MCFILIQSNLMGNIMKQPKQHVTTIKTSKNINFDNCEHWAIWGLTLGWFFRPWKILTQPMALKLVEMNGVGHAVQLVDGHIDPLTWISKSGRPTMQQPL